MQETFIPQSEPAATPFALNPADDIPLFCSLRYSSYNFAPVESGTDLYAHKDPDGKICYYLWHWSEKPGCLNTSSFVTEDFAVCFIREMYTTEKIVIGLEHMNLLDYLPGLYWGKLKKM